MICNKCGRDITSTNNTCPNCGESISNNSNDISFNSQNTSNVSSNISNNNSFNPTDLNTFMDNQINNSNESTPNQDISLGGLTNSQDSENNTTISNNSIQNDNFNSIFSQSNNDSINSFNRNTSDINQDSSNNQFNISTGNNSSNSNNTQSDNEIFNNTFQGNENFNNSVSQSNNFYPSKNNINSNTKGSNAIIYLIGIVMTIIIVFAIFITVSGIDDKNNTTTGTKSSDTISLNGIVFTIPTGYTAKKDNQYGIVFVSETLAFSIDVDFYNSYDSYFNYLKTQYPTQADQAEMTVGSRKYAGIVYETNSTLNVGQYFTSADYIYKGMFQSNDGTFHSEVFTDINEVLNSVDESKAIGNSTSTISLYGASDITYSFFD